MGSLITEKYGMDGTVRSVTRSRACTYVLSPVALQTQQLCEKCQNSKKCMTYKAKLADEAEKENTPPTTLAGLAPNLEPSKLAFMQEQVI